MKAERADRTRLLLACGAVGPPLFIVAFLVEGATRAGYSPLRHPVSSLSIGDYGWTQRLNFVVTGLLIIAFALGLRPALRRYGAGIWAPLLVGLVGLGLIGAGVFVADPLSGYPPGTGGCRWTGPRTAYCTTSRVRRSSWGCRPPASSSPTGS